MPEWELAELTAQAELHNQRIVDSETSVLDDYWLLGRLLEQVRGNFKRGSWLPWLDRRGIDHTRAKRARLLAEVFTTAEELRGLTLHEALRIARERKKAEAGRAEPKLSRRFKLAVKKLLAMAGELADDESAHDYSALADELGAAAAAICRACRPPEGVEVDAADVVEGAVESAKSGARPRRAMIDGLNAITAEADAPHRARPGRAHDSAAPGEMESFRNRTTKTPRRMSG